MGAHTVSVIIPTKNPGSGFVSVLASVCEQKTGFPYEVLVVDSGSTDGTIEHVQQLGDHRVRLHRIAPHEFGHGRTRNLGISLCDGTYAAFLTHDARPARDDWLATLVAIAEMDASVAGVFGRHLANPDANPFTVRDLISHFEQFEHDPVHQLQDHAVYARSVACRRRLRFFSDNNALVRRAAWERIPYPDVEFAEDQLWAQQVIEGGWKIAYAHNACVYHSHDYGFRERLRRSFDEAYAVHELFGDQLLRSAGHAFYFYAHRTLADFAYARRQNLCRSNAVAVRKMPLDNLMRACGYYLGGRGKLLPRSVRNWLSLDRRLLLGLDNRMSGAADRGRI
ncbi:glycosyltransferase family 2 protein [Bordetella flabilis]|uniref:glycosyltransferase family 2 protein n=1 Tax=Bordetella flabilis TaxID=463014 RepID=UPI000A025C62|nr:glycosyltransferase [Bordetella flabilis]